jgi:hypothetical protein
VPKKVLVLLIICHKEDRKSNDSNAHKSWKNSRTAAESIKNTEAINESEERKDFPEVICIK